MYIECFNLSKDTNVICRHMTERAGLGKMSDFFSEVKHLDTEPGWYMVTGIIILFFYLICKIYYL